VSLSRFVISLVVAGAVLGGCAKPPAGQLAISSYTARPASAIDRSAITGSILSASRPISQPPAPERIFASGHLAGRTLAVASTSDIILHPGEVILTFDDGPRPGRTDAILETLDRFGVKATFMMLGNAAEAHPEMARRVALAGHSVGSHSYDHADLTLMTRQEALDDIAKGERAIARALAGSGVAPAPFFRFPYLSQSGFLRTSVMQGNIVVLDVDVDSKDYYKDTPEQVAERTLQRLEARGSGIILFHDIHPRTVAMLPGFLQSLEERGYSVVRLVPRDSGIFGRQIITADAPLELRGGL
jgi:peptidoglycan-N-acetylglucosamine deacetylase